jgi:hypothetical protein
MGGKQVSRSGRESTVVRTALALLTVMTLVAAGTGVVTATSHGDGPTPEAVCTDVDGATTAVILPDGSIEKSGQLRMYEGTSVRVVLCIDGEPEPTSAWTLPNTEGFGSEQGATGTRVVSVRGDGRLDLAAVPEKEGVDGPVLETQSGYVGRATVDETEATLRFDSESSLATFRERSAAYRSTAARISENTTELNETLTESVPLTPKDTPAAVVWQAQHFGNETDEYQSAVMSSAMAGDEDAVTVVRAAERRDERIRRQARAALLRYTDRLQERRRRVVGEIRINFFVPLLVGLSLGVITGWFLTKGPLSDHQQLSGEVNAELSIRQFGPVLLVTGAMLLVALIALAASGMPIEIVEVLL